MPLSRLNRPIHRWVTMPLFITMTGGEEYLCLGYTVEHNAIVYNNDRWRTMPLSRLNNNEQ